MRAVLSSQPKTFDYVSVLKPRESLLLTFIGTCAALIAAGNQLSTSVLVMALLAIGLGSAGSNGFTNFLDREADAKMQRTRNRALPSRRIYPAQKALPLIAGLIIAALTLAWILNPLCFVAGLIGVVASGVWRKTISCTFLGIVAGCSPVLVGWFAFKPALDIQVWLICCLVAVWTPIHVWSVMVANREDYLNAGLKYFPLTLEDKDVVKMLFGLSVLLYAISLLIYLLVGSGLLYLIVANVLGMLMVYTSARLFFSPTSLHAWRVYKLSAFPYLGVIFLTMVIDTWLMSGG